MLSKLLVLLTFAGCVSINKPQPKNQWSEQLHTGLGIDCLQGGLSLKQCNCILDALESQFSEQEMIALFSNEQAAMPVIQNTIKQCTPEVK